MIFDITITTISKNYNHHQPWRDPRKDNHSTSDSLPPILKQLITLSELSAKNPSLMCSSTVILRVTSQKDRNYLKLIKNLSWSSNLMSS